MPNLINTAEMTIPESADPMAEHPNRVPITEESAMFAFLPTLDLGARHPREIVDVVDAVGHEWTFAFIYQSEQASIEGHAGYFLTGLSDFLNAFNLKIGDTLIFERRDRNISVDYCHARGAFYKTIFADRKTLRVGGGFKTIQID